MVRLGQHPSIAYGPTSAGRGSGAEGGYWLLNRRCGEAQSEGQPSVADTSASGEVAPKPAVRLSWVDAPRSTKALILGFCSCPNWSEVQPS